MLYENKNNNILKRGKGRPRRTHESQQQQRLPSEFVECIFCFRVFDLNAKYRNLQQAIINDKQFCPTCWQSEIIEKEYEDEDASTQNNIIADYFMQFGIRRN